MNINAAINNAAVEEIKAVLKEMIDDPYCYDPEDDWAAKAEAMELPGWSKEALAAILEIGDADEPYFDDSLPSFFYTALGAAWDAIDWVKVEHLLQPTVDKFYGVAARVIEEFEAAD